MHHETRRPRTVLRSGTRIGQALTISIAMALPGLACSVQEERLAGTRHALEDLPDAGVDAPDPDDELVGEVGEAASMAADIEAFGGGMMGASSFSDPANGIPIPPPWVPTKPTSPLTCSDVPGPNIIRVKFREGSRIRLNGQGTAFFSDGGNLTTQEQNELAAINNIANLGKIPSLEISVANLEALHTRIEQATGFDEPDLTLWYRLLVGVSVVDPASSQPTVCDNTANLINQLHSYALVTIALPADGQVDLPEFPFLALATDIPPVTTLVHEPAHMAASFPGFNSPLSLVGLPSLLSAAYRGDGVGIADVEDAYADHEKYNIACCWGGAFDDDAGDDDHGVRMMGIAFGTRGSPRYGTRGRSRGAACVRPEP